MLNIVTNKKENKYMAWQTVIAPFCFLLAFIILITPKLFHAL